MTLGVLASDARCYHCATSQQLRPFAIVFIIIIIILGGLKVVAVLVSKVANMEIENLKGKLVNHAGLLWCLCK